MLIKKIMFKSVVTIACCLPLLANAGDLTIINKTKRDSTTKIKGGLCSTDILGPKDGVTKAGETKVIKEFQIRLACTGQLENCVADVYMADKCGGPVITTMAFSVSSGIKSWTPPKAGYRVTKVSPFSIRMDGGPAAQD